MPGALDLQLAAYHRLRPQIQKEGWALVAREALVAVFDEFDQAALYADQHYSKEEVLIRHTSEHKGVAPFIVARS